MRRIIQVAYSESSPWYLPIKLMIVRSLISSVFTCEKANFHMHCLQKWMNTNPRENDKCVICTKREGLVHLTNLPLQPEPTLSHPDVDSEDA